MVGEEEEEMLQELWCVEVVMGQDQGDDGAME